MPLFGIDISRYQAGINLRVVPCDFVLVGTSDGATVNPNADEEYQAAVAAGKLVGVYHFFRNDPITEARFFASITKGYQNGKTVFVIDAETANPNLPALTKQFADEFKRLAGIKPMVYTYWQFLQSYNWTVCRSADLGLWGAWYPLGSQPITGYLPPARQDPPYWGSSMAMWQFTSQGRLPGYAGVLDLNVFYGDKSTWLAYAAKAGTTITPSGDNITPIQEDELSAADVTAINGYTASLLLYGFKSGGKDNPGIFPIVVENQRRINTANANIAALQSLVQQLAKGQGVTIDYDRINDEVKKALADGIKVTGTISGAAD